MDHGLLAQLAAGFERGLRRLLAALFKPENKGLDRTAGRVVLAGLYLLGAGHWAYFFNWGKVPFDLHDWTQTGAYYSFLRQALLTHQLPLHMLSPLVSTDRYLARPDTLFSPQGVLLAWLEPGPFMLANVLVLFSVGFLALLLIRRRYHLSPVAFTALFLIFNFNGHITAHFAAGHSEWVAYFLLPFFTLLALQLVESYPGSKPGSTSVVFHTWRWVACVALVMFAIFLQGGVHFFVWCLIFLAVLAILRPRYARPAGLAIVFAILLSLLRILAPAFQFAESGPRFISGFPTLADMLAGLVLLKTPSAASNPVLPTLGWWEVDTYVGLLGLAFLLIFGIYRAWRSGGEPRSLFAPLFVLVFLSVGQVYRIITALPLPLVDSERVTTRFLILPIVFLAVMGAIQLQHYLDKRSLDSLLEPLFYLGLLILMAHDLLQHSRLWRVANMYQLFKSTPVDIHAIVSNHADPAYFIALGVGLAGTVLTGAFLVWKAWPRHSVLISNSSFRFPIS